MEDTLAAVRRRLNHVDPYEEWEKETRQEAFVRRVTVSSLARLTEYIARREAKARTRLSPAEEGTG